MNKNSNTATNKVQDRPEILDFFFNPHSLEELREFGRSHQYTLGPNSLVGAKSYLTKKLEGLRGELRQVNAAIIHAAFLDSDKKVESGLTRRSVLEERIKVTNWLLERVNFCQNYEQIDAIISERNTKAMIERQRNEPKIFDPRFPVASSFGSF